MVIISMQKNSQKNKTKQIKEPSASEKLLCGSSVICVYPKTFSRHTIKDQTLDITLDIIQGQMYKMGTLDFYKSEY